MIQLSCDKYPQRLKEHLEEQERGGCFHGGNVLQATSTLIVTWGRERPSWKRRGECRCTHALGLQEAMVVQGSSHGTLSGSLMESTKSKATGSSARVSFPPETGPCRAGRTTQLSQLYSGACNRHHCSSDT